MSQADLVGDAGLSGAAIQPRNYLRPCLLLLLGEGPTYGYELRDKLEPLKAGRWDPGTVYRTLNTMEDDALVHSTWERSAEGPRRRRYDITPAGRDVLDSWADALGDLSNTIIDFIARYEADRHDDVDLAGTSAPAPAREARGDELPEQQSITTPDSKPAGAAALRSVRDTW